MTQLQLAVGIADAARNVAARIDPADLGTIAARLAEEYPEAEASEAEIVEVLREEVDFALCF